MHLFRKPVPVPFITKIGSFMPNLKDSSEQLIPKNPKSKKPKNMKKNYSSNQ